MAKKQVKRTPPKPSGKAVARKSTGKSRPVARPAANKPAVKPTVKPALKAKPAVKPPAKTVGKSLNGAAVKTAVVKAASVKTTPVKTSPVKTPPVKTPAVKPVATAARPQQAPVPVVKPANARPMLMQGPIAAKSLTKKGTFAFPLTPTKPAAKPVRKKVERIEPQFVVVQPPVAAVATSQKAAKNKAGLGQKDLDHYRGQLLAKRRELVGDMSHMEREALRENNANLSNLPVHMADQGTDAYEQEFTLGLVEKDRVLLREINDALAKIQNGTYGICEGTGNPIGKPRLDAQPWARHSIEYARLLEKRQMPFRR